jgi:hypothetical protein
MSELSPRSKRLLARASEFGEPTAADAARIRRAVVASVGVAAGGAAASGSALAGVVKVTIVFAISASLGSGAVYISKRALEPAPQPRPTVVLMPVQVVPRPAEPAQPTAVEEPAPAEAEPAPPPEPAHSPVVAKVAPRQPVPAPSPAQEPAPAPPAPVPAAKAAVPPPPPTPAAACDLGRELSAVERAQQQLEASPADALRTLGELEHVCPQGDLMPERATIRALALCALGRREEGAQARRWLEEHQPQSPGLARVRQACPEP